MPQFRHFIITRFSIRPTMTSTDRHELNRTLEPLRGSFDPLAPEALEQRFRLFEIACLPAVRAQTMQDFTWLIVVDRDLPGDARARLERLIAPLANAKLHTYDPAAPLGDLEWIAPYIEAEPPEYLLTTNLDDDDALPRRFVEWLHELIEQRPAALAPVETFGANSLWEWDLEVTRSAPRGYRAAWHRQSIPVVSVGFSLLARYPDYRLTVMRVPHNTAQTVLDWTREPENPRMAEIRSVLEAGAERRGDRLQDFAARDTFHEWAAAAGLPTMTNHQINVEGARLYESKERSPVTGPDSFPDVEIDWAAFDAHASAFRRSRRMQARYQLARVRRFIRRHVGRLSGSREANTGG